MLSGVTDLMMMKSDVLNDIDEIKVCVGYDYNGKVIDYLPYNACTETLKPVFQTFKGWKQEIKGSIPLELNTYIDFIEKSVGLPVRFVSYGPDRNANILR